jgi:hypothetical protein
LQQQQQQKEKQISSQESLNKISQNSFNISQAANNYNKSQNDYTSDVKTTNITTNNNSTIQITKVVSSRGQYSNNGVTGGETNNLLYYNKGNNQLVPISQSPNNTFISRNPISTMTTTNKSVSTTIPKFYTTSKMFASHYVNNNNSNSQNATSHLATLNSNINRFASQVNTNNNFSTSQNTNTVTINPRFLSNINTNVNSSAATNNSQQQINSNSGNNNFPPHLSSNTNNNYLSNNFYQNIVEPDEEVVVEEEEELGHAETYASYMPTKCN